MILSPQLRPGMAIRFNNHTCRVLAADYHSGQGKMGGGCHARLRGLSTGALWNTPRQPPLHGPCKATK